MKTITLTTAVLLAIKSFETDTFSIWSVTSRIRDDVNTFKYELTDFGRSVYHDEVKKVFLELLGSGLMDDYYIHNNPGGYREFCSVDPTQPQSAVVNTANSSKGSNITVTRNTATVDIKFPPSVQEKMYNYIKSRGPATMKQIQSRLKGYNYTCQELYDFFNKIGLIDKNSTTTNISEQYTVCL